MGLDQGGSAEGPRGNQTLALPDVLPLSIPLTHNHECRQFCSGPLPHNHRCEHRQFCAGLSLIHTPDCHRMPDPRAVGSDCHMICSFYCQPSTPFLGWHLWWLLTFNRRRKTKPAPKPFGICFPLSAMMAGLKTSTYSGAAMSSRHTGLLVPISRALLGKVTA